MKSILADFRRTKAALTILKALNFDFVEKNFTNENVKKYKKIQNLELLKWSKWQFLGLQDDQNCFAVSLRGRKILKLCITN